MIRYITDHLKISSEESGGEQIKTKYHVKSFLTRVCEIVNP